jgi:hypothetical protein
MHCQRRSAPQGELGLKLLTASAAIALFGWLLLSQPTSAMNCEEDALSDVSGSGAILEMLSGQIYRVDDSDQVDSSLWLASEDVLICSKTVAYKGKALAIYSVINKDENGEEVFAERLK